MADDKPTLYGYYRSSTSYRLRILLNLKNLAYDTVNVRLDRGEQHAPEFLALNPMGALPVLRFEGRTLIQSPAMIDYVEERFPSPSLLPANVDARQRVREIASLVACDIHPVNNLRILQHLREAYALDDQAIGDWYRTWIRRGFDALEQMLAVQTSADHAVGESVTLAEVYLVPQIYNARRFNIEMSDYPRLARIDAHCQGLPAFADAHPDRFEPDD